MSASVRVLETTYFSIVAQECRNDKNVITKRNTASPNALESIKNEITILTYLQTCEEKQNHMQMLGYSRAHVHHGKPTFEIVFERADVDLFDFAKTLPQNEVRWDFTRRAMWTILKHVRSLHRQNVVHNDIKLENIVIRNREKPAETLAFIDFGFACLTPPNQSLHAYGEDNLWLDDGDFGTKSYRHPSLFLRQPTDLKVADLYACGMACYALLTDSSAFNDRDSDATFLYTHTSFMNGSWITTRTVPSFVRKHPEFNTWVNFMNTICNNTCNYEQLLQHPFLIENKLHMDC